MSRKEVINCFRNLHRTRKKVFGGDVYALQETRKHINTEFRKNIQENNPEKIQQLLKEGNDVELLLRTTVVQAKETKEGYFVANVRKDIDFSNNAPRPKCC